jgi:hypothetical protein
MKTAYDILNELMGIVVPTPPEYNSKGHDAFQPWELRIIDLQNEARRLLNTEASALTVDALMAIRARVNGEWDNGSLKAVGPMTGDTAVDVLHIISEVMDRVYASSKEESKDLWFPKVGDMVVNNDTASRERVKAIDGDWVSFEKGPTIQWHISKLSPVAPTASHERMGRPL